MKNNIAKIIMGGLFAVAVFGFAPQALAHAHEGHAHHEKKIEKIKADKKPVKKKCCCNHKDAKHEGQGKPAEKANAAVDAHAGHGSQGSSENRDIYAPAMDTMMATMPPALGDADADFMRQMIVHHQAAIDMANVALQNAQNPDVRELADLILTAQKSEIAHMEGWLKMRNIPIK